MEETSKGFTLIEILVVATIIGLVGTFAAVAVNSARAKQRDATRLSHVRQVQSALEEYYLENNVYPVGDALPLGSSAAACLDTNGFEPSCDVAATNVLVRRVQATLAKGLKGTTACGGSANAYCYAVRSEGRSYIIQFELENNVPLAGFVKGSNCATPDGIKPGPCQ